MDSVVNVVRVCAQWYDPLIETTVSCTQLGELRPSLGSINFLVLLQKLACVSREGKIVRKAIRKSIRVLSSVYKLPHFYSLKELVLYYEHHIFLRIRKEHNTGCLKFAIKYCDGNIVNYFLNYWRRVELFFRKDEEGFAEEYRQGLEGAARIGNVALVESLRRLLPEDTPQIYKKMSMLEVMLKKASSDEKNPVISYCIDNGACMFDRALKSAAKYGNLFLMDFYYEQCLEDRLIINWDNVLASTVRGGHKEAIKRVLNFSSNWTKGLKGAIVSKKEGSMKWVNFFTEKLKLQGKYNIDFVIESSVRCGRLDVIKSIVQDFTRKNYDSCVMQCVRVSFFRQELVDYVLEEYEKILRTKKRKDPRDIDMFLYAFRCDKDGYKNILIYRMSTDSYWYNNEANITEFLKKLAR